MRMITAVWAKAGLAASVTAGLKSRTTSATTLILVLLFAYVGGAQNRPSTALTSPKQQFGHEIGDDYFLANYTQYAEYLLKLDASANRHTTSRALRFSVA